MTSALQHPHSMPASEVLQSLESDTNGLTAQQVADRLKEYGPNALPEKARSHLIITFLRQFDSFLVYILLLAAGMSLWLRNYVDMWLILAILMINALIGFVQEYRANKAIKALKSMISPEAHVFREGALMRIDAMGLVPGDVILVHEGDQVPADARIIDTKDLLVVESALTGESLPVQKETAVFSESTPMADRKNMVWMSTWVASGEATGVVTATGINTAIGHVAHSIRDIKKHDSVFQKGTRKLTVQIGLIALVSAVLIFLAGFYFRHFALTDILLFALAALVAAIPEGLPAVIAIVLAIGAFRMARKHAIIRRLPATLTVGHTTVITTDKTGTLTQNTINVISIVLPDGRNYSVTGEGWEPQGDFFLDAMQVKPLEHGELRKVLEMAALCSDARLVKEEKSMDIIGDPTEAALVVLAEKAGLSKQSLQDSAQCIHDFPFNKALRYHAVIVELQDGSPRRELIVIGAPETVLSKSGVILENGKAVTMSAEKLQRLNTQIRMLAQKGMRVLACACRTVPGDTEHLYDGLVQDLTFVALIGMKDPARPEARKAISAAHEAGIRVIMKTGDHRDTALALAQDVGLTSGDDTVVLEDDDLAAMNDTAFASAVRDVDVFARLTPDSKLRIIRSLQQQGEVVAMTGDGVNDAPALQQADVGIAMGKIGTDVARAASDMVIADDNFATVVEAVRQGRIVFRNIRRVIWFLLTTNFAEAVTLLTALLLGMELPLFADPYSLAQPDDRQRSRPGPGRRTRSSGYSESPSQRNQ